MIKKILIILSLNLLLIVFVVGIALSKNCYVSKNGDNTDGLSWSKAWNDIDHINGIEAGDVVYIAAGTYTGSYTFSASGTGDDSRITIKRATTPEHGSDAGWNNAYDGSVNIASSSFASFVFSGRSYITIDGVDRSKFMVYGQDGRRPTRGFYGNGSGTHNVTIKNLTVHNMKYAGIHLERGDGAFEIDNCEIYKCGYETAHDRDACIIFLYMENPSYGRSSIHDCYLHDPGYIQNYRATDILTGAIDYCDIYDNHFYSGWCRWSSSDMTHINGDHNYIYNNVFEAALGGNNQNVFLHTNNPASENPTDNYIYNNLFYKPSSDIGNGALSVMVYDGGTVTNTYVYNNIFYGHRWSVFFNKSGSGSITGFVLKNNIFWPNDVQERHIYDCANAYATWTLDYNYYHTTSSDQTIIFSSGGNKNFTQAQTAGWETNGAVGNPHFDIESSVTAGFHLTKDSPFPVVVGGADLSTVFDHDKNGIMRKSGAWDMGCYAYTISPSPPQNLAIVKINP